MSDIGPILRRIKCVIYDRGPGAYPRFELGDKGTPEDYRLRDEVNAICSKPGRVQYISLTHIPHILFSEWGNPKHVAPAAPLTREHKIEMAVRRCLTKNQMLWALRNEWVGYTRRQLIAREFHHIAGDRT